MQIVNGTYPADPSWMRTGYTVSPSSDAPGMCVAQISFERMTSTTCGVPQGTERLFVFLMVPAI